MDNSNENKPWVNWAIFLGIALFIYVAWYGNNNKAENQGLEAEINIFPMNAEAKNYRLPAYIDTEKHVVFPFGSYHIYTIDSYKWPSADDYTEFRNRCTIDSRKGSSVCAASDGREYRVEVVGQPEESVSEN